MADGQSPPIPHPDFIHGPLLGPVMVNDEVKEEEEEVLEDPLFVASEVIKEEEELKNEIKEEPESELDVGDAADEPADAGDPLSLGCFSPMPPVAVPPYHPQLLLPDSALPQPVAGPSQYRRVVLTPSVLTPPIPGTSSQRSLLRPPSTRPQPVAVVSHRSLLSSPSVFVQPGAVVSHRRSLLKPASQLPTLQLNESVLKLVGDPPDVVVTTRDKVTNKDTYVSLREVREHGPVSVLYRGRRVYVHLSDTPPDASWGVRAPFVTTTRAKASSATAPRTFVPASQTPRAGSVANPASIASTSAAGSPQVEGARPKRDRMPSRRLEESLQSGAARTAISNAAASVMVRTPARALPVVAPSPAVTPSAMGTPRGGGVANSASPAWVGAASVARSGSLQLEGARKRDRIETEMSAEESPPRRVRRSVRAPFVTTTRAKPSPTTAPKTIVPSPRTPQTGSVANPASIASTSAAGSPQVEGARPKRERMPSRRLEEYVTLPIKKRSRKTAQGAEESPSEKKRKSSRNSDERVQGSSSDSSKEKSAQEWNAKSKAPVTASWHIIRKSLVTAPEDSVSNRTPVTAREENLLNKTPVTAQEESVLNKTPVTAQEENALNKTPVMPDTKNQMAATNTRPKTRRSGEVQKKGNNVEEAEESPSEKKRKSSGNSDERVQDSSSDSLKEKSAQERDAKSKAPVTASWHIIRKSLVTAPEDSLSNRTPVTAREENLLNKTPVTAQEESVLNKTPVTAREENVLNKTPVMPDTKNQMAATNTRPKTRRSGEVQKKGNNVEERVQDASFVSIEKPGQEWNAKSKAPVTVSSEMIREPLMTAREDSVSNKTPATAREENVLNKTPVMPDTKNQMAATNTRPKTRRSGEVQKKGNNVEEAEEVLVEVKRKSGRSGEVMQGASCDSSKQTSTRENSTDESHVMADTKNQTETDRHKATSLEGPSCQTPKNIEEDAASPAETPRSEKAAQVENSLPKYELRSSLSRKRKRWVNTRQSGLVREDVSDDENVSEELVLKVFQRPGRRESFGLRRARALVSRSRSRSRSSERQYLRSGRRKIPLDRSKREDVLSQQTHTVGRLDRISEVHRGRVETSSHACGSEGVPKESAKRAKAKPRRRKKRCSKKNKRGRNGKVQRKRSKTSGANNEVVRVIMEAGPLRRSILKRENVERMRSVKSVRFVVVEKAAEESANGPVECVQTGEDEREVDKVRGKVERSAQEKRLMEEYGIKESAVFIRKLPENIGGKLITWAGETVKVSLDTSVLGGMKPSEGVKDLLQNKPAQSKSLTFGEVSVSGGKSTPQKSKEFEVCVEKTVPLQLAELEVCHDKSMPQKSKDLKVCVGKMLPSNSEELKVSHDKSILQKSKDLKACDGKTVSSNSKEISVDKSVSPRESKVADNESGPQTSKNISEEKTASSKSIALKVVLDDKSVPLKSRDFEVHLAKLVLSRKASEKSVGDRNQLPVSKEIGRLDITDEKSVVNVNESSSTKESQSVVKGNQLSKSMQAGKAVVAVEKHVVNVNESSSTKESQSVVKGNQLSKSMQAGKAVVAVEKHVVNVNESSSTKESQSVVKGNQLAKSMQAGKAVVAVEKHVVNVNESSSTKESQSVVKGNQLAKSMQAGKAVVAVEKHVVNVNGSSSTKESQSVVKGNQLAKSMQAGKAVVAVEKSVVNVNESSSTKESQSVVKGNQLAKSMQAGKAVVAVEKSVVNVNESSSTKESQSVVKGNQLAKSMQAGKAVVAVEKHVVNVNGSSSTKESQSVVKGNQLAKSMQAGKAVVAVEKSVVNVNESSSTKESQSVVKGNQLAKSMQAGKAVVAVEKHVVNVNESSSTKESQSVVKGNHLLKSMQAGKAVVADEKSVVNVNESSSTKESQSVVKGNQLSKSMQAGKAVVAVEKHVVNVNESSSTKESQSVVKGNHLLKSMQAGKAVVADEKSVVNVNESSSTKESQSVVKGNQLSKSMQAGKAVVAVEKHVVNVNESSSTKESQSVVKGNQLSKSMQAGKAVVADEKSVVNVNESSSTKESQSVVKGNQLSKSMQAGKAVVAVEKHVVNVNESSSTKESQSVVEGNPLPNRNPKVPNEKSSAVRRSELSNSQSSVSGNETSESIFELREYDEIDHEETIVTESMSESKSNEKSEIIAQELSKSVESGKSGVSYVEAPQSRKCENKGLEPHENMALKSKAVAVTNISPKGSNLASKSSLKSMESEELNCINVGASSSRSSDYLNASGTDKITNKPEAACSSTPVTDKVSLDSEAKNKEKSPRKAKLVPRTCEEEVQRREKPVQKIHSNKQVLMKSDVIRCTMGLWKPKQPSSGLVETENEKMRERPRDEESSGSNECVGHDGNSSDVTKDVPRPKKIESTSDEENIEGDVELISENPDEKVDASHILVTGKAKGKITVSSPIADDSGVTGIEKGSDKVPSKGKVVASGPSEPSLEVREVAEVAKTVRGESTPVCDKSTPLCNEKGTHAGRRSGYAERERGRQKPDRSSVSASDSGLEVNDKDSEKTITPCASPVISTSASSQIEKCIEFSECSDIASEVDESVGDIGSSSQRESTDETGVDTDVGVSGDISEEGSTPSVVATGGEERVGAVRTCSVSANVEKENVPTSLNSIEDERDRNESSGDENTTCPPVESHHSRKSQRKFHERVLSVAKACERERRVYEAPLTKEQDESLQKLFLYGDRLLKDYVPVQNLMRRCPGAVVDTLQVPKKPQSNEGKKLKVKLHGKMTSLKDVNASMQETVTCPVIKFKYGCAPEKKTRIEDLLYVPGYQNDSAKKNFVPKWKQFSADHNNEAEGSETASTYTELSRYVVKLPPDSCSKTSGSATFQYSDRMIVDVNGQKFMPINRRAVPYPQAVQTPKVVVTKVDDAVVCPESRVVESNQSAPASAEAVQPSELPRPVVRVLPVMGSDGNMFYVPYSDRGSGASREGDSTAQTEAVTAQTEAGTERQDLVDAIATQGGETEVMAVEQDQVEPVAIKQSVAVATQHDQADSTFGEETVVSSDVEPVAGTVPLPTGSIGASRPDEAALKVPQTRVVSSTGRSNIPRPQVITRSVPLPISSVRAVKSVGPSAAFPRVPAVLKRRVVNTASSIPRSTISVARPGQSTVAVNGGASGNAPGSTIVTPTNIISRLPITVDTHSNAVTNGAETEANADREQVVYYADPAGMMTRILIPPSCLKLSSSTDGTSRTLQAVTVVRDAPPVTTAASTAVSVAPSVSTTPTATAENSFLFVDPASTIVSAPSTQMSTLSQSCESTPQLMHTVPKRVYGGPTKKIFPCNSSIVSSVNRSRASGAASTQPYRIVLTEQAESPPTVPKAAAAPVAPQTRVIQVIPDTVGMTSTVGTSAKPGIVAAENQHVILGCNDAQNIVSDSVENVRKVYSSGIDDYDSLSTIVSAQRHKKIVILPKRGSASTPVSVPALPLQGTSASNLVAASVPLSMANFKAPPYVYPNNASGKACIPSSTVPTAALSVNTPSRIPVVPSRVVKPSTNSLFVEMERTGKMKELLEGAGPSLTMPLRSVCSINSLPPEQAQYLQAPEVLRKKMVFKPVSTLRRTTGAEMTLHPFDLCSEAEHAVSSLAASDDGRKMSEHVTSAYHQAEETVAMAPSAQHSDAAPNETEIQDNDRRQEYAGFVWETIDFDDLDLEVND